MPRLKYYAAARPGDKYWTILKRPRETKLAVTFYSQNASTIVDALNFHDKHLREKEKQAKVKTVKKK